MKNGQNLVILEGTVCFDLDKGTTQKGTPWLRGVLENVREFAKTGGEKGKEINRIRFVMFGKASDLFAAAVVKDTAVSLTGALRVENTEAGNGGNPQYQVTVNVWRFQVLKETATS
jgi:single-stranded DNA-binding protein